MDKKLEEELLSVENASKGSVNNLFCNSDEPKVTKNNEVKEQNQSNSNHIYDDTNNSISQCNEASNSSNFDNKIEADFISSEKDQVKDESDMECESILFSKKSRKHRAYRSRRVDSSSEDDVELGSVYKSAVCNEAKSEKLDDEESKPGSSCPENYRSTADGNMDTDSEEISSKPAQESISKKRSRKTFLADSLPLDSDSDNSDNERERRVKEDTEIKAFIASEIKRLNELARPKTKWLMLDELIDRQIGGRKRSKSSAIFSEKFYGSLYVPKRLELTANLAFHRGCVNALNFNMSGTRLASGSDDFHIAVWDWAKQKKILSYNSGHRDNVFQSKFLPLSGDSHIVSCSRDGQVKLAELSSSGICGEPRKIAKHTRAAHKLATHPNTPHVVLSAGEDSVVLNIDIRESQPKRIALVKDVKGSKVALYSIQSHPIDERQYLVTGRDRYVRVYDRRCGGSDCGPPAIKYCPQHLDDASKSVNITCGVYSNNGDAILASYNDDDIYLFDTSLSEGANYIHRYTGHRNDATVKGVNFFGSNSQFVVSGSDCGNIFLWDRETESVVQCVQGDESGVVNVLEPHPYIPVLATSGLDNDIKIWMPTRLEDADTSHVEQLIRKNLKGRFQQAKEDGLIGSLSGSNIFLLLFRHFSGRRRLSRASSGSPRDDDNEEDSDSDSEDLSDTNPPTQCTSQ